MDNQQRLDKNESIRQAMINTHNKSPLLLFILIPIIILDKNFIKIKNVFGYFIMNLYFSRNNRRQWILEMLV